MLSWRFLHDLASSSLLLAERVNYKSNTITQYNEYINGFGIWLRCSSLAGSLLSCEYGATHRAVLEWLRSSCLSRVSRTHHSERQDGVPHVSRSQPPFRCSPQQTSTALVRRGPPFAERKGQGNVEYLSCALCDYSRNPIRLQRSLAWTMNPISLTVQDGE